MFIPKRDHKLATYKTNNKKHLIRVLSTSRVGKHANDINTLIHTQKMLLKYSVEKTYVIAFDTLLDREMLANFEKYPFQLHIERIEDILEYCRENNNELLIKQETPLTWLKLNPFSDLTDVIIIDL
jgi:hypothetical protein